MAACARVRVIPCLDVDAGRVVKGVRFTDLFDAGDPVELAARYDAQGADELVFLDITASSDDRDTMVDVVARTAEQVFIPFTVGGGVRAVEDARAPAPGRGRQGRRSTRPPSSGPSWCAELADEFGGQCVVVAIDARGAGRDRDRGLGGVHPRRPDADRAATPWPGPSECAALGAGEILLTSMDRDGTRDGFDLELTRAVADAVRRSPWSPRAGWASCDHLVDGAVDGRRRRRAGRLDLPPAASSPSAEAKAHLAAAGVAVRPA